MFGEWVRSQVSSSLLDCGSKIRGLLPIALALLPSVIQGLVNPGVVKAASFITDGSGGLEVACLLRKPKVAGSTPAGVDRFPRCENHSCELQGVKNGSHQRKIRYNLQFFFGKSKNASQATEIGHDGYGVHTVTANYVQFWYHRFRSGIFDVKDAPRTPGPSSKMSINSQK
ncbi:hypothetical protein TNCV_4531291 [Trichonephila clavipes]|nr:hypothetical protein TNCV_4531291 [Trichonephila clavipes]